MRPLDDRLLGALLDLAVNISGEGSVAGNLVIFIYLFIYLSYGDKPFFFYTTGINRLNHFQSITFNQSQSISITRPCCLLQGCFYTLQQNICSKTTLSARGQLKNRLLPTTQPVCVF